MTIRVGPKLKAELPEDERKEIVKWLEAKAWKTCFLCQGPIEDDDELVADHDEVRAAGGPTTRDNLNVAHVRCNAKKGGMTTEQARDVLAVERYLEEHGPGLMYGGVIDHFGITPKPITVMATKDIVEFRFSDKSRATAPVYSEINSAGREFRFSYLELPREAISNDDDCQPRTVKPGQLRQIYLDIHKNPLHEPPSCRLEQPGSKAKQRLLMFDGQHKTIASWMLNRDRIVVKVYLDMDLDEAVTLVNSIQSKIKKLPLTPFELVAKLDQEHRAKFEAYLKITDPASASEDGFIKSLEVTERQKAKQGLEAAVIRNVTEADDELALYRMYVQRVGLPPDQKGLTEAAFKNKVLKRLLQTSPLTEPLSEGKVMRERERQHVLRALNALAVKGFGADGSPLGKIEAERARRMGYQSALQYISYLLRRTFTAVLNPNREEFALMEKEPSKEQWAAIEAAIDRIIKHPVWTTDLEKSDRMRAVQNALSKNQDAAASFQAVGLTPGYVVGAEKLPSDWFEDPE